MSPDDELLPLKRVLELARVSRSTLWRAAGSEIEGFPKPIVRGRRLFWRAADIPVIVRCLEVFEGRSVFDRRKKNERRRRESQHAALVTLKHAKTRQRRKSGRTKATQGDLFSA